MGRYGNIAKTKSKPRENTRVVRQAHPVSSYVDSANPGSVVFAYMFPRSGTVRDILMLVEELNKKTVEVSIITVPASDVHKSMTNTFRTPKGVNYIDRMEVAAGDRVKVVISSENDVDLKAKGIWVSFLYQYGGDDVEGT